MKPTGPENTEMRHLRLRGGELDGVTWSGVIDVGQRVCCGAGQWFRGRVYVVTDETIPAPEGQTESIAVPAAF